MGGCGDVGKPAVPVNASSTLGFAVVSPAALSACAAEIRSSEKYSSDSAISVALAPSVPE